MKKKITELKLNPNNPRFIKDDKFEKLKKSVQDFPEMLEARPIIIDEDCVILGGNMRYRAAKELGYKEVPVKQLTGLSEERKREFVIKDNAAFGEWDWEMIANEWTEFALEDWGINVPKFIIEDEIPVDGAKTGSLEDKLETYMNASIKQIVLYYELEEYEDVLKNLDKIAADNNLPDNSSVIQFLIKAYNG